MASPKPVATIPDSTSGRLRIKSFLKQGRLADPSIKAFVDETSLKQVVGKETE
jgi:hypothetical protein